MRVAFRREGWPPKWRLFSTDFQPVGASDYSWEFEVKSNISGETVRLHFDIGSVPDDYDVQLIDPGLDLQIDLRQEPTYAFASG